VTENKIPPNGRKGDSNLAQDASHLKVPKIDTVRTKFKDGSHIKTPPKPQNKPEK
jgi:hypothetical protein